MKVYISLKVEKKEEFNELAEKLKKLGHEIVTDWSTHLPIKPYQDNPEQAREYSMEDMQGVLDCDVFIQLTIETGGTGMYIELGAAIAMNLKFGKPEKIYIVGDHNTRSIFYFHPSVIRKNTIEEVLEDLE